MFRVSLLSHHSDLKYKKPFNCIRFTSICIPNLLTPALSVTEILSFMQIYVYFFEFASFPNSFTSTSCTCCLLKQLAGVQGTNNRQTAGKSITPTTQQLKHTHTDMHTHSGSSHPFRCRRFYFCVCLFVCVCARREFVVRLCSLHVQIRIFN